MNEIVVFDTTGRADYPPAALAHLEGLPVRLTGRCLPDEAALVAEGQEAHILLVTGLHFTEQTMRQLPHLRGIVRYGVGLDRIDLDAAAKRGIAVRNVTGFCTEEIADHCLGLLIACARGMFADALHVRHGNFRHGAQRVLRLRGRCLGIVGFGAIGRALAIRAQALGLTVLAHDPYVSAQTIAEAGARPAALDELLSEADFVSLNCALTDDTRHLLGREQFACMKPGAFLINTARGGLVDQPALVEALQSGRLGGAALDVLDPEPPAADDPLLRLDNVTITPHVAWHSEQALEDLVVGVFAAVGELVRGMLPGRGAMTGD
jgi:D-3-phosphoglycerate dehydrogenase